MENALSVEQATQTLYTKLSECIGWKLLKSQRCLKKTVGELVFEIDFYSSKWNSSFESVRVNAALYVWNKSFDKRMSVNSVVSSLMYTPVGGTWFDISAQQKLDYVCAELAERFQNTAVRLAQMFEQNRESAVRELLDKYFYEYDVRLDYAAQILGEQAVKYRAQEIMDALSDTVKKQIPEYLSGARNAQWMFNRSNLRYIIDNQLVDLQM
jgi:hypothetical protein